MTGINKERDPAAIAAETLLVHYSFDLSHSTAEEVVKQWLQKYPTRWLRLAIIEALYQGRYKSISVEQILICWQRRAKALYHFNLEFERLICAKLPGVNLEDGNDETSDPSFDSVADSADPGLTNESSIAKPPSETSDRTATDSPSHIPSHLEESSESTTSHNADSEQSETSGIVCTSAENRIPKPPSSKPLSAIEIKNQMIADILEDPWLTDRDEAALQTILNSELNSEPSNQRISQCEHHDSVLPETHSPIHEFNPTADSSEFYTRLKAVLQHKLKNPEEKSRKRHRKQDK